MALHSLLVCKDKFFPCILQHATLNAMQLSSQAMLNAMVQRDVMIHDSFMLKRLQKCTLVHEIN